MSIYCSMYIRTSWPILKLAVATSLNQPSDVFGDVKDDNSDTQTHMINIWFDSLHLPYNSTKRRYTPHGSYEKRQIGNLFVWIKMLDVYCIIVYLKSWCMNTHFQEIVRNLFPNHHNGNRRNHISILRNIVKHDANNLASIELSQILKAIWYDVASY